MNAESIALVMPQSAWAFLLQWQGLASAWMLPLSGAVDVAQGATWLQEQGLLVTHAGKALLDSGLNQWAGIIVQATFALDVKTNAHTATLLRTPECCLWVLSPDAWRLSISTTTQPMRVISAWINATEATYGIRAPDGQRWLCAMPWPDAQPWLADLLGKD